MNASDAYQTLVSITSENWLIERLFFASLEFAALALFLGSLVFFLRLRSARLISLLWLLVLTKPLVSLAIGSPVPVVQLLAPPSRELSTMPVETVDLTNQRVPQKTPVEIRFAHTPFDTHDRTTETREEAREQSSEEGSASITSQLWPFRLPEIRAAHLIVAIWLAGIAYFAIVELLRQFRTRRLVASSLPPSAELSTHLARLARQISGRRIPSLRVTDQLESPALVGVFRPVILIPSWLADEGKTNMSTLTWTLRHELMHWKLGDPIANSIPRLAQILFFFHPAAWWASKRWRVAMELACDRALVATEADAQAYAEGLYHILSAMHNRRRPALSSSLFATRTQIGRRIKVLLNAPLDSSARLSAMMVVGVILLSAVSLLIGGRFTHRVLAEQRPDQETATGSVQDETRGGHPETSAGKNSNDASDTGEQADPIAVTGRVLDPDGKPLAGAKVSLWCHFGFLAFGRDWHPQTDRPLKAKVKATSDSGGSFHFTIAKSEIYENPMNLWKESWVQVEATAEGYGPAWCRIECTGDQGGVKLRLARDDVPIKGRVVDPQGRPVAGARVQVERLTAGANIYGSLWRTAWAGWLDNLTTDKDGRFVLTGIGRDRQAVLHISAPTIEHVLRWVRTDAVVDGKPVDCASIEVIAKPTKPIVGTIRAKDSGQPLAGVVVYGGERAYRRGVRAVTDADGRYRLVGMPKAGQYEVTVYPPIPLGYVGTRKFAADTEGLSPLSVDIELRRGIEVRVRFIDKVTRKPVRGHVQTTPLCDNPYYAEAEFEPGDIPTREWFRRYAPDMDGVFRVVTYPGPSLLMFCAQANTMRYLRAHVDPADVERYHIMGFAELSPAYRVIDTKETDKPLVFEIELDPGRTLTGTLIGPERKPVNGATAHGLNYNAFNLRNLPYKPEWENESLATDVFSVRRLESQTARTVSFVHKDRKLIGHLVLHGDEEGPLEVQLNRWGTVTGRLLDGQGKPLKDVSVELQYPVLPAPGMRPWDEVVQTDADGRFRVEGLAPGLKHELALERTSQTSAKDDKEDVVTYSADDRLTALSVPAGEIKDLGDIRVNTAKPKQVHP